MKVGGTQVRAIRQRDAGEKKKSHNGRKSESEEGEYKIKQEVKTRRLTTVKHSRPDFN